MAAEKNNGNSGSIRSIASHHLCYGITVKDLLYSLCQFLLPLILAIFTIVITFDQRNENRIQRDEDRRLSDEQRLQDLNISAEQRENDRWIAEEQRKYDREIAGNKREADDLNAAMQRNMTYDQRVYEINIEQERYKKEHEKYLDNLLLSYYNEMGELFQKTNGTSFAFYPISSSLARAKTLNVIQQIGPIRSAHLIMFLYGANQLKFDNKSIDLSQAGLNYIDLRSERTLIHIYLVGAFLNNASFDGQDLSYANFQGAQLNYATFKRSICIGTIFDDAHLVGADFTDSNISLASFIRTNLQRAKFHKTTGKDPYFQYARMQQTNFSDCHLSFRSTDTFTFVPTDKKGFIDSNLAASNFYRANLKSARFMYCNLTEANFTNADLGGAYMTGSVMSYASFFNTNLGYTILFSTNLSYANLTTIRCLGTIYNISACKIYQSLTLENAHLPNKSFGLALTPVFTEKDHPYCPQHDLGKTFPFVNDSQWNIKPLHSVLNQYRFLPDINVKMNACVFTPINTNETVNMTRNIDLTKYNMLIRDGRAQAILINLASYYSVLISITQLSENQIKLEPDEWIGFRWRGRLKRSTTNLQVTVQFREPVNHTFRWFHDLQLFIYADLVAPDTAPLHWN